MKQYDGRVYKSIARTFSILKADRMNETFWNKKNGVNAPATFSILKADRMNETQCALCRHSRYHTFSILKADRMNETSWITDFPPDGLSLSVSSKRIE